MSTLKALQSQRRDAANLVKSLGGSASNAGKRGRPAGKRTRTNWDQVIASFKGSFSIDDLAKASKKAKGTVNQAIQNLKKAKKIKSTGKRGEYQRVVVSAVKPKASKKKTARTKSKAKASPKAKQSKSQAPSPAGETTASD